MVGIKQLVVIVARISQHTPPDRSLHIQNKMIHFHTYIYIKIDFSVYTQGERKKFRFRAFGRQGPRVNDNSLPLKNLPLGRFHTFSYIYRCEEPLLCVISSFSLPSSLSRLPFFRDSHRIFWGITQNLVS